MNIRENEPLRLHTTLRAGGPARFFVEARTEGEIKEAIAFAKTRNLPVFVLGAGSNVLASDHGFDGVVLNIATRCIQTRQSSAGRVEVIADAGEVWDGLAAFAVERGLYGLENMSSIPGTVGAAVVGNIGAYGAEVREMLLWAETLDMRTGSVWRFTNEACEFGYRRSFFKTAEGRNFVVVRAAFVLDKHGPANTRYRDVAQYLSAQGVTAPTAANVREAVITIRRRKLPDPSQLGTAGSFFKNPVIPRPAYEALLARCPGLSGHDEPNGQVKIPLSWILDKVCGLKGIRRGRVGTYSEHALVIVNDGGTAADVETFAHEVARTVHDKTGIHIEWEVEKLGSW